MKDLSSHCWLLDFVPWGWYLLGLLYDTLLGNTILPARWLSVPYGLITFRNSRKDSFSSNGGHSRSLRLTLTMGLSIAFQIALHRESYSPFTFKSLLFEFGEVSENCTLYHLNQRKRNNAHCPSLPLVGVLMDQWCEGSFRSERQSPKVSSKDVSSPGHSPVSHKVPNLPCLRIPLWASSLSHQSSWFVEIQGGAAYVGFKEVRSWPWGCC